MTSRHARKEISSQGEGWQVSVNPGVGNVTNNGLAWSAHSQAGRIKKKRQIRVGEDRGNLGLGIRDQRPGLGIRRQGLRVGYQMFGLPGFGD